MKKHLTSLILIVLLLLSNTSLSFATEPSETVAPAEPSELVELSEPVESTEADDPENPEEPVEPVEPVEPGETENPEETETPEEPGEPVEPEGPVNESHAPYIGGMPDGAFHPNAEITRAELAVIIYALGDYEPGPSRFSDVRAKAWYAEAVNALAAAGVLGGFPDGTFRPAANASRAELVTILAAVSGETPTLITSFSDVSPKHWARDAISLAQEKGWVGGFPDGTFRPGKLITRAETVVILNQFLGRIPDSEAIVLGEGLRFFPDVRKGRWYYEAVMEAATAHDAIRETAGGPEHWENPTPGVYSPIPDGFYSFDGKLFAVEDGDYVRTAGTGTLNGISYTCKGSSGVCTAWAEVLTLANKELVLLAKQAPIASPGGYKDGFYVKAGHLFVARDGYLLRTACTGQLDGIHYVCTGPSGHCSVEDWAKLNLRGIDLSVFSDALTPEATLSGDEAVTLGELLQAAARVYEAYFRVEYPLDSDQPQDFIDRALEYGILNEAAESYDRLVSQGEAAVILWRSLRGRALAPMNEVARIPDVSEEESCYPCLLDLYRAGVMDGYGEEHNACITEPVSVSELAEYLARLEQPDRRVSFTISGQVIRTIQYGTSGSGKYPLTAYQLGDGKNVMVLTFAIHGWEDNWDRDGQALVYLADQVESYLENHYDLIEEGDWTVYILRCLNPDGLNLGNTCNGPGRCTTTYLDANGALVTGKGIDMNRSFPYQFRCYSEPRNFNGSAPLASRESRAVADFFREVKGSGSNICIDTHGWFGQIITSGGMGTLYNAFAQQFPYNYYASLSGGSGYLSSWAAYVEGYDSCLLELPDDIYSFNDFLSSNCVGRFEAAIRYLLLNY